MVCSDINSFFSGSNSQPLPFASRYLIMHFQEHRSCRLGPPREHAGVSLGVDLSTQVGTNNGKGPEASRPQHVAGRNRSEEHTSELQSLMRISYAVFCLKKKKQQRP